MIRRQGFSIWEAQVALVILAVTLSGLCPLLVMQSRHQEKLEARLAPAATHYLTPSTDEWARKLGAAALSTTQTPAPKPAAPILLLDDGDSGYSETGSDWTSATDAQAYGGDSRWHSPGMGLNTATWQFTGLQPGWYNVQATWHEGLLCSLDAPYTVYDGSTSKGTFQVNQSLAPSGSTFDGRPWQSLAVLSIHNSSVSVVLSDNTLTGRVYADGVRLVPVRNIVSVSSLERTLTGEEVTAQVVITVQTP